MSTNNVRTQPLTDLLGSLSLAGLLDSAIGSSSLLPGTS